VAGSVRLRTRQTGAGADWPVFNRDAARSGVNSDETAISADTVAGLQRVWSQPLPELADEAPVLLSAVPLPDGSTASLLFLTTAHGSTLALNAATGATLWQQDTGDLKVVNQRCQICASPAIDPSRQWLYAAGNDGAVHRYAVASGAEDRTAPWPVPVTLMNGYEKRSSALNIANDTLYVAMSGYFGDFGPYVGHVIAIALADGSNRVFNVLCSDQQQLLASRDVVPDTAATCDKREAGVWARAGVVADQDGGPTDGSIFFTTGNGPFDANNGGVNYGDTVLRLSGDAAGVLDYYTPTNYAELDARDIDLGSTAPALLPPQPRSNTPYLLVQGGKDSVLRLVDRTRMGGAGGELQQVNLNAGQILTAPAVWQDPQSSDPAGDAAWLFVTTGRTTAGYRVSTDASGSTTLQEGWRLSEGGTSPATTGDVLFVAGSSGVTARDPRTGKALWSSNQPSAGGNIGGVHWQSPIVAGGRLYIADNDGHISAYGLPGQ